MNKPLQIYMAEGELERLDSWAKERGWTKSQAVRAAIRAFLRAEEKDPLLAASGMIDGLPEDCAANFDRYLEESFVAEARAPYGRKQDRSRARIRR